MFKRRQVSFFVLFFLQIFLTQRIAAQNFSTTSEAFEQTFKDVLTSRFPENDVLFQSRSTSVLAGATGEKCVVINIHGLYSSPKDQRTLAQHFQQLGCHVISPLLLGHWRSDPNAFEKLTVTSWMEQVDYIIEKAKTLSPNIILVGHSTGGLISFLQAARRPADIRAAILFAPALRLQPKTQFLGWLGSKFKLSRISKTGLDPEYDSYVKPAQGGDLVNQMIRKYLTDTFSESHVEVQNLKVPLLIFAALNDATIDSEAVFELQKKAPADLIQVRTFTKESAIEHDNIQRGLLDVVEGAPNSWINPFMDQVLNECDQFIATFIR